MSSLLPTRDDEQKSIELYDTFVTDPKSFSSLHQALLLLGILLKYTLSYQMIVIFLGEFISISCNWKAYSYTNGSSFQLSFEVLKGLLLT